MCHPCRLIAVRAYITLCPQNFVLQRQELNWDHPHLAANRNARMQEDLSRRKHMRTC